MSKYIPTIGIECHVQLKTATKLFAAVGNDAKGAKPNTLVSHICFGLPGALPVLNGQALSLAVRAALALNTKPQKFSKFDRKHYFYPDLPKGYQITQYDQPIITDGWVEIEADGKTHKVGVERVNLEEDAGKSLHPANAGFSLVDLNRAGTPLLEIVSKPEIHSAEAAKAYARELYLLMLYADISDCDLHEGHMRFDVNVSVSHDLKRPGTRSEVKNLNSFRSVQSAVAYEIHRQTELLEAGQSVVQETRGWDEAKQKTVSQRGKEEAHDYRYFPEPDVPPLQLTDSDIQAAAAKLPSLPQALRRKLKSLDLDNSTAETLIEQITAGQFMELVLEKTSHAAGRHIANWLAGVVQALVSAGKLDWTNAKLELDDFVKLADMVDKHVVSATAAKTIAAELALKGGKPSDIAKRLNLLQVSDQAELLKIVKSVLSKQPEAVKDYKAGQAKALGFLVGQVMAASQGRANPGLVKNLLESALDS